MKSINFLNRLYIIVMIAVCIFANSGCGEVEKPEEEPKKPKVETLLAINVTEKVATLQGKFTVPDGGPDVNSCWFELFLDGKSIRGNITAVRRDNSFSCDLHDLTPGTNYHVQAFAENADGEGQGERVLLSMDINQPIVVTTDAVKDKKTRSITVDGTVVKCGTEPFDEYGVCYSMTSATPAYSYPMKYRTASYMEQIDNYNFSMVIDGLEPYTDYFVWAYAKNDIEEAFGKAIKITTDFKAPDVHTSSAHGPAPYAPATVNGLIIDEGEPRYSERGVCYSKKKNPTVNDSIEVVDGTGSFFTAELFDLEPGTYYAKAYARYKTDKVREVYGNALHFNVYSKDAEFTSIVFRVYVDGDADCRQFWTSASATFYVGDSPQDLIPVATVPVGTSVIQRIEKGKHWVKATATKGGEIIKDDDPVEYEVTIDEEWTYRFWCNTGQGIKSFERKSTSPAFGIMKK